MFIRTERLFLRPGWPEDRDDLYRAIADPAVIANLSRVPWPYTRAQAQSFLERPAEHGLPRFLITRPQAGGAAVVGGIGLQREGGGEGAELGYWIARREWGQGYASEAACAVTQLARTLGHRRLVASHFIDNPASGKVLRKAGLRPTGHTCARYGAARGQVVTALEYALDLAGENCAGAGGGAGDGPGDGPGDDCANLRACCCREAA